MGSLTFYLAARYSRREELCGYKAALEERGHAVPARWLLGAHHYEPGDLHEWEVDEGRGALDAARRFEDLLDADVIVAFTEDPHSPGGSRGGSHVEFGIAAGLRLAGGVVAPTSLRYPSIRWYSGWPRLFVVGPVENVFHAHDVVDDSFEDWQEFLLTLDMQPAVHGWSIRSEERCDQHPWHKTNSYHDDYYRQSKGVAR